MRLIYMLIIVMKDAYVMVCHRVISEMTCNGTDKKECKNDALWLNVISQLCHGILLYPSEVSILFMIVFNLLILFQQQTNPCRSN